MASTGCSKNKSIIEIGRNYVGHRIYNGELHFCGKTINLDVVPNYKYLRFQ